jgi:hypothetical protein
VKRCGSSGAHPPARKLFFSHKFFAVRDRHLPGRPDLIHLEQAKDLLCLIRVPRPSFGRGEGEAEAEAVDCPRYEHFREGGNNDLMKQLKPEFADPESRDALLAVASHRQVINGRRLWHWLSAHLDRVVDGRGFVRPGLSSGSIAWQLLDVAAAAEAP